MSLKLIATTTVGSGGAANIEFTSIPQTYTDLMLVVSSRSSVANADVNNNIQIRLNGESSNHSERQLFGTGTSTGTASLVYASLGYVPSTQATSNTFGSSVAYIPNYTSSTAKSISAEGVAEGNTAGMFMAIGAGLWTGTAAITSITLLMADSLTIQQHSTASLYGITKGSDGIVTTS
jgi:hypothetical protein